MKIKVLSVEITQAAPKGKGKPWENAEIVYQNERGEPKKWNLVSFANPAVFAEMKHAKSGESFEITTVKNGDYTNWTSATKVDGDTAQPEQRLAPTAAQKEPSKYVSTYETPEERAVKQRLIVRQSSLAQAVAFFSPNGGGKMESDEVLDVAETFAAWVYKQPDLFDEFDDVPL